MWAEYIIIKGSMDVSRNRKPDEDFIMMLPPSDGAIIKFHRDIVLVHNQKYYCAIKLNVF